MASVERRAFRMAHIATGQREEALDIVQDAMLKLVQHYAQRSEEEWGALFQTILQSTIRDWYRRQKVRNQWRRWLGFATGSRSSGSEQDDETDVNDTIQSATRSLTQPATLEPSRNIDSQQSITALDRVLHQLPIRQQQAFLLRVWEGLSVEQTADVMQCSQGSVKTHLSRAMQSLRQQLEDFQTESP